MPTVLNYAALRSYTLTPDDIFVQGYSAIGDGGEGYFFWDPTSTDPDNDGTTIDSGFALGRWKRVFDSVVNAKWFGAKGDGTTNDTTALENCYNSGFNTFTPAGIYIVNTLSLTESNVIHSGTGKGSVIKQTNGQNSILIIYYLGANDFHWENICFDGNISNNSTQTAPGLDIRDSFNFSFRYCTFQNFRPYSVALDSCHSTTTSYTNIFSECDFNYFVTAAIYATQANGTTGKTGDNLIITNCNFSKGRRDDAINLSSAAIFAIGSVSNPGVPGPKHYKISSCFFDDIDDSAIIANRFNDFVVTDCTAKTFGTCFYFGDASIPNAQLLVSGCSLTSTHDSGLIGNLIWDFSFVNNTIFDCYWEGISIESANRGTISGNCVNNNGKSGSRSIGINISDVGTSTANDSQFLTINGNICADTRTGGSKTQEIGIFLNSYSDSILVNNNIVVGNKTKDILVITGRQLNCMIRGNYGETYIETATSISSPAVIDFTFQKHQILALGQNVSLISFIDAQIGDVLTLTLVQYGSYVVSGWNSNIKFVGGISPVISTTASLPADTFTFLFNGSDFLEIGRTQDVKY